MLPRHTKRLFLDTSPLIYFIEAKAPYVSTMRTIFQTVEHRKIKVVTSPVTLAEGLVYPIQTGNLRLQSAFRSIILYDPNTRFQVINLAIGERAALLRANYHLKIADSLQLATAIETKCDIFLTNDLQLKRVQEISVICIDDLLTTPSTS